VTSTPKSVSAPLRALLLLGSTLALGACSTANGPDPGRSVNERMFRLNQGIDRVALAPLAEGYRAVTPDLLRTMIGSFYDNLRVPRTFLNDLLQGKPLAAVQDLGRVTINVVAGIGGLIDVASEMGIPHNEEDFGQTLGRWGVPPGAYVVLPIFGPPFNGPNNPRDILTWIPDVATDPTIWVNAAGLGFVRTVDTRARYLDELAQLKRDSIDFYVGVRDLYMQRREAEIRDGAPPERRDNEDLYEVEDDDQGAQTNDSQP
jgi:phospholipid-binding lipoprotein MlaA